jgi:hypothetical protein
LAFSFLRGEKLEKTVQKARRIGTEVRRAKKMVVLNPPPTFHDRYSGIPPRREKRRGFEKLSLPGPSAGRGAFLMVGYYAERFVRLN